MRIEHHPAHARAALALTAATAIALLAGCAGPSPGRPDAPPAEIVSEVTCDGAVDFGAVSTVPGVPDMGRVPDGFEPVAAYRCLTFQSVEDDDGIWGATTRERLEGDLGELLAALREPDDPLTTGACPAIMAVMPELWLVDADGQAVRVRHPLSACNLPKEAERIASALDALTVTDRIVERRALAESRAALDAECPTTWGVQPLQIAGAEGLWHGDGVVGPVLPIVPEQPGADAGAEPRPDPSIATIPMPLDGPPSPDEIDTLRLCAYSTAEDAAPSEAIPEGADAWANAHVGGTAWFTHGRTLDATATRAVLEAAAFGDALETSCRATADTLVVLHSDVGSLWVELDGCRRLIVNGLAASQASPSLLDLVAGE